MMQYRDYFAGKKITLMGLGLLGRGVGDARFLAQMGAELIVTDLKDESALEVSLAHLRAFPNITFHLGGHRLEDFKDRDLILKAAGVPRESPFIAEAKRHDIPVRMSADLFAQFAGVPVIGVTGTRGKSTTTYLIAHILRLAGFDLLLGGNIKGISTLALLPSVRPDSLAVLELDSWQLQGFGDAKLSPEVAAFTTFMPDHLNYYNSGALTTDEAMRLYFADKANIFLHQQEDDTLIMSEQVAQYVAEFGYQRKIRSHAAVVGPRDLPAGVRLRMPGEHNRLNAAVAAAVARVLSVEEPLLREALESFVGVPGRLELVREVGGIKMYNDTTSTVPDATVAALGAIGNADKKNVVLIMGGSDKGLDMQPVVAAAQRYAKAVFLLDGTGTNRIKNEFPAAPVYTSMEEAVRAAYERCGTGDALLLSPAFASFGMFQNEYERGDQFDAAVKNLR